MLFQNRLDIIMYDIQRHGKIAFYMTNFHEEATQIGSAYTLEDGDAIYGQYRDTGILFTRGYTLEQYISQCFGAEGDLGKGRQMPVSGLFLSFTFS